MTSITLCRRCSVPVLPGAGACPFCGVADPEPVRLSAAVRGCWVVVGAGALAVTYELVALVGRAIG
jgi:hypothetical protein